MEVERFKYQAENAAECARSGNYTLEDENLLLEKARTIVKCYIDSDIPPRIQVFFTPGLLSLNQDIFVYSSLSAS